MKHPPRTTVSERVVYIAGLMSRDRWERRVTEAELSGVWGVGVSAIRNYAAEASRSFRLSPEEKEALRENLRAAARHARRVAMTERSKVTGLRDIGAALKAIELEARLIGLDAAPEQGAPAPAEIVVRYGEQLPPEDDAESPAPGTERPPRQP